MGPNPEAIPLKIFLDTVISSSADANSRDTWILSRRMPENAQAVHVSEISVTGLAISRPREQN